MTRHDYARTVLGGSVLLLVGEFLLAGTAQTPQPVSSVIAWGAAAVTSGNSVQPLGPAWCRAARKEGGTWIPQSAHSTVSGWFISENNRSAARLIVELDPTQLTQDLQLDVSVAATPGAVLRVELVDDAGNAVGASPASNLVAGCNGSAQSYAIALPLTARPLARAVRLTRVNGGLIVYNTTLSPLSQEVLTAGGSTLAGTGLIRPSGTNTPALGGTVTVDQAGALPQGGTSLLPGALAPGRTNEPATTSHDASVIYVDAALGSDAHTGRRPAPAVVYQRPRGGGAATVRVDGPKATIRAGLAEATSHDRLIIRAGEYAQRMDLRGRDVKVRIDGAVTLRRSPPAVAMSAPPGWWTSRGVLTADPPNDYAPATAGQLKHIASMAKAELDDSLPGGAGAAVDALVASFQNQHNTAPVNLGQLKNVAKPFYDRLIAENLATGYPWTLATDDDRDFAPANLGQVKHVFSFNLDTDGDGLPNWWEAQNGLNPAIADADSDNDADSVPAWAEYKLGTPANQYTPSVEKIGDAVTIEYRSARVTRDKVAFPAFKRDAQAGIRRRYTEFTGSGTFDRSCADDWRSYGEWSLQRNVGSVSALSPLIGDFVAAELHSRSCAQPPPPSHGWDQTYSAASTAAGMWTKTYAHAANLSPCSGNETEGGTVGWAWDPLDVGWNIGLGCIIDLYAAYIGGPTDYWPFSPLSNVTLWDPTEFDVFGLSDHGGNHQFHLDNEYTTTMLEVNTYNDLASAPTLSTLQWSEGWHKRVELEGYSGVDDWTLGTSYIATETVAAYTAACWVVDAEQVRCERARINYRLKVQTDPNIVNRVSVYEVFADESGAKTIARTVPSFVMGTGQEEILEDPDFVIPPPVSKGWQYPTVLKVEMTAYRPTTEGPAYGNHFDRHEIPNDQEESPGAGIRVNGDDDNNNSTADENDTTVNNENDLIEVVLDAAPPAPSSGFKYVLKRSSSNIKVWTAQNKTTALLDANDETNLTFSTTPMTVWVENPGGGTVDLELQAKTDSGTVVCSDKVHFYPFTSVIVLFEGEFGVPTDPPAGGISTLGLAAYENGYDVHVYDEPDIGETPNTEDAAFAEIDSAVENRGVTAVAIIGYSHGGGSVFRVSDVMDNDATAFNLAFTAYIDAITQPLLNVTAEDRRPVGSAFHVNYFQVAQGNDFPLYLDGTPSTPAGAGFFDNVDDPVVTESHTTIDDAAVVQDGIRTRLFQQVNP